MLPAIFLMRIAILHLEDDEHWALVYLHGQNDYSIHYMLTNKPGPNSLVPLQPQLLQGTGEY